jgi:autoinducer 2-degrading protein
MIGIFVSFRVKPEMRKRFLAAAGDDSMCSVRDEPGCSRFDVLEDRQEANRFHFYEIYEDDAAFQAHMETPHYARWRDASPDFMSEPSTRSRFTVAAPLPYQ